MATWFPWQPSPWFERGIRFPATRHLRRPRQSVYWSSSTVRTRSRAVADSERRRWERPQQPRRGSLPRQHRRLWHCWIRPSLEQNRIKYTVTKNLELKSLGTVLANMHSARNTSSAPELQSHVSTKSRDSNQNERTLVTLKLYIWYERENRRHPRGSENQTKKNELAWMGIEPMAFGLALRSSNHWATETPHLNHHIQLRYHRTADNVAVAWLSGCSDPKLGMAARIRYSRNTFPTRRRVCSGTKLNWPSMNGEKWRQKGDRAGKSTNERERERENRRHSRGKWKSNLGGVCNSLSHSYSSPLYLLSINLLFSRLCSVFYSM